MKTPKIHILSGCIFAYFTRFTRTLPLTTKEKAFLSLYLSRRPVRGPLTLCILFLSAYAAEPLRTAGLLGAAHQYSLQDVCGSARTPIPTELLTHERQFKNLKLDPWKRVAHKGISPRVAMQTSRATSSKALEMFGYVNHFGGLLFCWTSVRPAQYLQVLVSFACERK